jgi:hypothetical protein
MKKSSYHIILLSGLLLISASSVYAQEPSTCNIGEMPAMSLNKGQVCGDAVAKSILDNVAKMIIDNPGCNVYVNNRAEPSKVGQQLCWDRINQVMNYLIEKKGIRPGRLIFGMDNGDEDFNIITFTATTEEGPSSVPPPFPNISKLFKRRSGNCNY